jgi:hypothetical protein
VPEERIVVYENTGVVDELYSEADKLVDAILQEYGVREERALITELEEVGVVV